LQNTTAENCITFSTCQKQVNKTRLDAKYNIRKNVLMQAFARITYSITAER